MTLPAVFYAHAKFTAIGFPKTHVYQDCRKIQGKVYSEFSYVPSGVCGICLKRWERELAAGTISVKTSTVR